MKRIKKSFAGLLSLLILLSCLPFSVSASVQDIPVFSRDLDDSIQYAYVKDAASSVVLPLRVEASTGDQYTVIYQWYTMSGSTPAPSSDSAISGATGSQCIPDVTAVGTKQYYVVATNSNNAGETATSKVVKVTVVPAGTKIEKPAITQLTEASYFQNDTPVALSVTASKSNGDYGTLEYQWYEMKGESPAAGDTAVGENKDSFIPPTDAVSSKRYYVTVRNKLNLPTPLVESVTSDPVTILVVAPGTTAAVPTVTDPADLSCKLGEAGKPMTVTAETTDSGVLSYQWYQVKEENPDPSKDIPMGTVASFTPPTSKTGLSRYYVVVTNTLTINGSTSTATAVSNPGTVIVSKTGEPARTPSITNPKSATYEEGAKPIPLVVSGHTTDEGGKLTYQWYEMLGTKPSPEDDKKLDADASTGSFLPPTNERGSKKYYVLLTNTLDDDGVITTASVLSEPATITIIAATTPPPPSAVEEFKLSKTPSGKINIQAETTQKPAGGDFAKQIETGTIPPEFQDAENKGAWKDSLALIEVLSLSNYSMNQEDLNVILNPAKGDGMKNLADMDFSKSVLDPKLSGALPQNQFSGLTNLKTASLPQNLSSLGDELFADCTALESLTIPKTNAKAIRIGEGVFRDCANLTELDLTDAPILLPINADAAANAFENAPRIIFHVPESLRTEYLEVWATLIEKGQLTVAAVAETPDPDAEAPLFTTQPQSSSYEPEESILPLTAEAAVTDDGSIQYQWYEMKGDTPDPDTDPELGTGTEYTPSVAPAETKRYYVVATNSKPEHIDAHTVSDVAVISVRSEESELPEFPETPVQPELFLPAGWAAPISYFQDDPDVVPKSFTYNKEALKNPYIFWYEMAGDSPRVSEEALLEQIQALKPKQAPWLPSDALHQKPEYPLPLKAVNDSDAADKLIHTGERFTPPVNEIGTQSYYAVAVNYDPTATVQVLSYAVADPFTITVKAADIVVPQPEIPVIQKDPVSRDYVLHDDAVPLTVELEAFDSVSNVSYIWYELLGEEVSDTDPQVGTGSRFIPDVSAEGIRSYYVVVTNTIHTSEGDKTAETVSKPAKITVTAPPEAAGFEVVFLDGTTQYHRETVAEGERVSPPEEFDPREGYRFIGWFIDEDMETAYDFDTPVTEDLTLYAGWVKVIAHNAYVSGYTDSDGTRTFRPGASVTRGEVAQMFYNLADDDLKTSPIKTDKRFSDVLETDWFYDEVMLLVDLEVLSGDPDGTFRPRDKITRGELASVIRKFFKMEEGTSMGFDETDVPKDYWAWGSIAALYEAEITVGDSNGKYHPLNPITRVEMVTMLNKALGRPADETRAEYEGLSMPFTDVPDYWGWIHVMEACVDHEIIEPIE